MTFAPIYIQKYDWQIFAFLSAGPGDLRDIMKVMHRAGISPRHFDQAREMLQSGKPNQGFTASSKRRGNTVMMIGRADSDEQFINTLQHELRHVVDHIASAEKIDPSGEEVAYLTGELNTLLAPYLKHYVCNCQLQKLQTMCNNQSPCTRCRSEEQKKERVERIKELLKMLEPELPEHVFQKVKTELQELL